MKKTLIIKTGTTFPRILKNHGDFEDYIMNQAGLPRDSVIVAPVYETSFLPEIKEISSVIITGSHSMVTDNSLWSNEVASWLRNLENKHIPVLGICYGHQLLAKAFGGVVDYHTRGKEFGTVQIELTGKGEKDPLFSVLPAEFKGHVAHSQSIISLPENSYILAKNSFEGNHGVRFKENIWGVQFHPEFNKDVALAYINELESSLAKDGYNIEFLRASVEEHSYGVALLKRFLEL